MSGHRRKDTLAWLVLGDKLAFFARTTLDRLNIALLKVQAHCIGPERFIVQDHFFHRLLRHLFVTYEFFAKLAISV